MPRESLDAAEDLPEGALSQVAFGELEDVVQRTSDEAPAGLEHPLLQARQRPAVDGLAEPASCGEYSLSWD